MIWTDEEDLILAEAVLRHIRENSTQLAAFEEVRDKLNKTTSDCGFRWNTIVRRSYTNAIELAKKQREQNFYHKIDSIMENNRRLTNEVLIRNDEENLGTANKYLLKTLKSSLTSIAALMENDMISKETAAHTIRNIAGNL